MGLLLYLIKRTVVGDFGLATSSLAAVDPSDVSPHAVVLDADMTLGVWFCPCASFPTGVDIFFFFACRGRNEAVHRSRSPIAESRSTNSEP